MELESYSVKQNVSKKTFTIRCYSLNNCYAIYRTLKMSKEEFHSASYWTQGDWNQFLKTDEYYKVR